MGIGTAGVTRDLLVTINRQQLRWTCGSDTEVSTLYEKRHNPRNDTKKRRRKRPSTSWLENVRPYNVASLLRRV